MSASILAEDTELNLQEPEIIEAPASKRRWWLWSLVLAVLLGCAILLSRSSRNSQMRSADAKGKLVSQSVPVSTATARIADVPGQLIKVDFQEGQLVHRGDLLAEIDPRPFQVQLEQADGHLAKNSAAPWARRLGFLVKLGVLRSLQLFF